MTCVKIEEFGSRKMSISECGDTWLYDIAYKWLNEEDNER